MRRSSRVYTSLNRHKKVMGVEKRAFMVVAFAASSMFATRLYLGLLFVPLLHLLMQWLTKKDYHFFDIFMRFMDEDDAYGSLPHPSTMEQRPKGWGKGLPC